MQLPECDVKSAPELLGRLLAERGLTKTAFAAAIGYTQAHVSRVVAGHVGLSAHFAYSVERAYGLPALELLHVQNRWQLHVIAHAEERSRSNPRKGNVVDIDEDQAEKDYRGGMTIHEVATKYEVSYGTIWRILDAREVPMRPFGGPVQGRPVGEQRGLRPHRHAST